MFDIGWTEIMVVAAVAILVVGPKELPSMLMTFGRTVGRMRRMTNELQSQFNSALREAERQANLDEVRKDIEGVKSAAEDPFKSVRDQIDPNAGAKQPGAKEPAAAAPPPAAPAEAPAVSAEAEIAPAEAVPDEAPVSETVVEPKPDQAVGGGQRP